MLAISTDWNCHRYTDGEALLSELRTLGLTEIEVGPGSNIALFPGFRRVLKSGRAKVISLANFTPAPIDWQRFGIANCELTSPSRVLREQALEWTRITIDHAAGLEASFVVLRLGRVGMNGFTEALFRQVRAGGLHSRKFVSTKLDGVRERARLSEAWLSRALRSLENLVPYAKACGIRLAITGAGGYEDGPTENEVVQLMSEFSGAGYLGYWHDFSATQRKANLGLLDHAQWLTEVRPHVLGSYVSDLRWPDETGCVPLSGIIPFEQLVPLLPHDTPAVWKIGPSQRGAELRQMLPVWEERFVRGVPAAG